MPIDQTLAPGVCDVTLCNKIERFSLSVWSHIKDAIGENCFDALLDAQHAHPGTVLDSQSRWWQGRNVNITKRSVTRVKSVRACGPDPTASGTP